MFKKSIFLFLVLSRTVSHCSLSSFNPFTPGLLNHLLGGGGGGEGAYRPASQKSNLPSINLKRKFCMSHRHRTIPDVKLEFGTFSIFGDMMQGV